MLKILQFFNVLRVVLGVRSPTSDTINPAGGASQPVSPQLWFPRISPLLAIAILPLFLLGGIFFYLALVLLLFAELRLFLWLLLHNPLYRHPLRYLLLIFAALLVCSVIFSFDQAESLIAVAKFLLIVWFATAIYVILLTADEYLEAVVIIIATAHALSTVVAIVSLYTGKLEFGDFATFNPQSRSRNYSFIGTVLTPLLFIPTRLPRQRLLAAGAIGCLLATVLIIEIRAPIVGFMLMACVLLLYYLRQFGQRFWLIMPIAAGVIAAVAIAIVRYLYVDKVAALISQPAGAFAPNWLIDPARQATWEFVIRQIPQLPLFGFGPYTAASLPGAAEKIPGIGVAFVNFSPHNHLLELLINLGWLGCGSVLLLLVCYLWHYWRPQSRVFPLAWYVHAGFWGIGMVNISIWEEWWLASYFIAMTVLHALAAKAQQSAGAPATLPARPASRTEYGSK